VWALAAVVGAEMAVALAVALGEAIYVTSTTSLLRREIVTLWSLVRGELAVLSEPEVLAGEVILAQLGLCLLKAVEVAVIPVVA